MLQNKTLLYSFPLKLMVIGQIGLNGPIALLNVVMVHTIDHACAITPNHNMVDKTAPEVISSNKHATTSLVRVRLD